MSNTTIYPPERPGGSGGGGGGGANSQALDGLPGTASSLPLFTGPGVLGTLVTGTAGRDIIGKEQPADVKQALGLGAVENTADADKPVSTAVQDALNALPKPGNVKAVKTLALLGDSLAGNNSDLGKNYSRGFLTFAQQMSGHRVYFDSTLNFGVGGDTSAQVAARVATVIAAKPDICLVEMGGNDTSNSGITADAIIANTKTVVDALTNAGIQVILCTLYPTAGNSTAVTLRKVSILNQWILDAGTRYNLVEVLDAGKVMFNNLTSLVKPNFTYDNTHPGGYGCWYLGRELAEKLVQMVRVSRNLPLNNIYDKWALADFPNGNILSNAQYTGTTGTISGAGGSGTIPTGLVLNTDDAKGATASVAVIAGADGFNTLEITLGGTVTGTDPRYTTASHIFLGEVLGGTSAWNTTDLGKFMRDTAVNQLLQMECEVENLVGVAAVGVETFHLSTGGNKPSNGDGLYTVNTTVPTTSLASLALPTEATPVKLTLRAEPEANTGKANGYRVGLHIVCLPGMTVSGKIRISRPVLRAYTAKLK